MSGSRKIDSNFTGLRVAEEAPNCVGDLPGAVPNVVESMAGVTLRLTLSGAALAGFAAIDPVIVSVTGGLTDTKDTVGAALAAALQTALTTITGSAVTYTAGSDLLSIPADRNLGDARMRVDAYSNGEKIAYAPTIVSAGTAATAVTVTFLNTGIVNGEAALWTVLEPNSYGDFGATLGTVARTPIKADRQREKGVTSDLDATANFQTDFTQDNLYRLLPGFFFADWRKSASPEFDNGVFAVTTNSVLNGANIDAAFAVNQIVLVSGFANTANNGVRLVSNVTTNNQIHVTDLAGAAVVLVNEGSFGAPVSTAKVKRVGVRAASGDLDVDAAGAFPAITSTVLNFTTLGLIPGQWIYIGGDTANSGFTNAANNGFARIRSIAANRMEFDKTQNTWVTEANSSSLVQLYFPDLIKNEGDPALIKTRSYQFERSLVTAGFEYVEGCVANTLAFNIATADKITADLGYIGTDAITRNAASRKVGSFPSSSTSVTAFNTSSDFSRIRTATQGVASTPLFAFVTEFTLNINNNVTPAKAVGVLGAFDVTVGDFVAEGNITAYFSSVDAIAAVRNNSDVTVDFALAKNNAGWVFDIPLLGLGEGRLNVEKDAPITIPVSIGGARDPFYNTTLQAMFFAYLPAVAEA